MPTGLIYDQACWEEAAGPLPLRSNIITKFQNWNKNKSEDAWFKFSHKKYSPKSSNLGESWLLLQPKSGFDAGARV